MYQGWECLGCDEDLAKNRHNDWKLTSMWNVKTKKAIFEEAKGEWMSDFESLACSIYETKKPSEESQGSFPELLRVFKDDFQLYLFVRDVRNMVLTRNDSQLERIGFYSALMSCWSRCKTSKSGYNKNKMKGQKNKYRDCV